MIGGVQNMNDKIETNLDMCIGCKRCDDQCPVEMANIIYQDEAGNVKVKVNYEKCVSCGRCIGVCPQKARYFP